MICGLWLGAIDKKDAGALRGCFILAHCLSLIGKPQLFMASKYDYLKTLDGLQYLYGKPELVGRLKSECEDFRVTEIMDVVPCGSGEHFWIDITKTNLSTDQVCQLIAKYSGVRFRDIGFSGLKDKRAVTRQWFSVWMPKEPSFDWSDFETDGLQIHTVTKHVRKIKRGTHSANAFKIRVKNLNGRLEDLDSRFQSIQSIGVPNYFGLQRFGRNASNLESAMAMFNGTKTIKNQNLRSLVLSAARSFLFNLTVSDRILASSFDSIFDQEPMELAGSNSKFIAEDNQLNRDRLADKDIHPTAPLWGRLSEKSLLPNEELFALENKAVNQFPEFVSGIESAGVDYARRSIRCFPEQLSFDLDKTDLVISFQLSAGQFATSVLRELVQSN